MGWMTRENNALAKLGLTDWSPFGTGSSADSTAVITTDQKVENIDPTGKDPTKYDPSYRVNPDGSIPENTVHPAVKRMRKEVDEIDLADPSFAWARESQMMQLRALQGRASTFLVSPTDKGMPTLGKRATLLGG